METQATDAAHQEGQETDTNIPLPTDPKEAEKILSEGMVIAEGGTVDPPTTEEPPPGDLPPKGEEPPPGKPPEGEKPTDEPPEPGTVPKDKVLPNRIGTAQFSEDEQAAIRLRKELRDQGQDVTLKEALELVEDRKEKSPPPQPPPNATDPVEALRNELTEIETKLDEAGESELFTKEVRTLLDQKAKLVAKIEGVTQEKTRKEAEQQAEIRSREQQNREQAKKAALAEFPSANDASKPLGKEVDSLVTELQDEKHPDHAVLFARNAAVLVTRMAAERLAERMSSDGKMTYEQAYSSLRVPRSSSPPLPPTPAEGGRKKVNPVSGSAGTPQSETAPTEAEVLQATLGDPKLADELLGAKPSGWVIQ